MSLPWKTNSLPPVNFKFSKEKSKAFKNIEVGGDEGVLAAVWGGY